MGSPEPRMETGGSKITSLRLAQLARASSQSLEVQERCELCREPIPSRHRHVFDLGSRNLLCACRACTVLFDRDAAGGGHYRLVPERRWFLSDLDLDDAEWDRLAIPVGFAFFVRSSSAERTVAHYPSPLGATEFAIAAGAWRDIELRNPVLAEMQPDVEALLVRRLQGTRDHWLVPLDECYALVGIVRTTWRGLTGGQKVWGEVARFFEELRRRSATVREDRTTQTGSKKD